jgi:hypothetical protein
MPIPPDLLQILSDAGLADPQNQLLAAQYKAAQLKKGTAMPQAQRYGDNHIAPINPMEQAAAAIQQFQGGKDSNTLMEAMSNNLRAGQRGKTALAETAMQPGADMRQMQILGGIAGPETEKQVGTYGQIAQPLEKSALLAQQNAARQKQLETTSALKLTLGQMGEEGKDRRFEPFAGRGTPLSGTVTLNKHTGEQTTTSPTLNPNASAGIGIKEIDNEAKANKEIRTALDPNGPRAGNFGNYAKRMSVLGDLETLIKQFPNPTARQAYEIARTFDNAVSMGAATVQGTAHLIPSSLYGDITKMAEYIQNRPIGQGQEAFQAQMKEMVDRQRQYWKGEIDKVVMGRLGSLKTYMNTYPDSTEVTLRSLANQLGVPEDDLMVHHPNKGKAGTPAAPAATGKIKKYNPTTDSFE